MMGGAEEKVAIPWVLLVDFLASFERHYRVCRPPLLFTLRTRPNVIFPALKSRGLNTVVCLVSDPYLPNEKIPLFGMSSRAGKEMARSVDLTSVSHKTRPNTTYFPNQPT